MSVGSIQKIRHAGKVVGFRDENGQVREMYCGGATRKRRLAILARKLVLFAVDEFGGCPTEAEVEALLKINEAVAALDKAGELI